MSRKFVVGQRPADANSRNRPEKVIMLVGETGSGKSTLINGMINYLYGVQWDDDIRYKLIKDQEGRSSAYSQTQEITAYKLYAESDMPIEYDVTIIDTPGFGDSGGIEHDNEVILQIDQFFQAKGEAGVDHIDAVGFVLSASAARLTPTQAYIFNSILSMYGRDIGDNIFLMTTFCDGEEPPVLEAVREANIPFKSHFKFNNSALYARKQSSGTSFNTLFWQIGEKSMATFFTDIASVEPKSLWLTREVLQLRRHLQAAVAGLDLQLQRDLLKYELLQRLRDTIRERQTEIDANKHFTTDVNTSELREVPLPKGKYITTCLECKVTCHYPCTLARDSDKAWCASMAGLGGMRWLKGVESSTCVVCPRKCHWTKHGSTKYRLELVTRSESRTIDEIKERYNIATTKSDTSKELLCNMEKELEAMSSDTASLLAKMRHHLNRLDEIALRPNPLSAVEYIDLLIAAEIQQASKQGFNGRVQALEEARKQAVLMETVKDGDKYDDDGISIDDDDEKMATSLDGQQRFDLSKAQSSQKLCKWRKSFETKKPFVTPGSDRSLLTREGVVQALNTEAAQETIASYVPSAVRALGSWMGKNV